VGKTYTVAGETLIGVFVGLVCSIKQISRKQTANMNTRNAKLVAAMANHTD